MILDEDWQTILDYSLRLHFLWGVGAAEEKTHTRTQFQSANWHKLQCVMLNLQAKIRDVLPLPDQGTTQVILYCTEWMQAFPSKCKYSPNLNVPRKITGPSSSSLGKLLILSHGLRWRRSGIFQPRTQLRAKFCMLNARVHLAYQVGFLS